MSIASVLTEDCRRAVQDPSHANILAHAAWPKVAYISQAFGAPPKPIPKSDGTLRSALKRLDAAQAYLVNCLEGLPNDKLCEPVPTTYGESAANLFLALLQHDIYHGGQISLLRNEFEARSQG